MQQVPDPRVRMLGRTDVRHGTVLRRLLGQTRCDPPGAGWDTSMNVGASTSSPGSIVLGGPGERKVGEAGCSFQPPKTRPARPGRHREASGFRLPVPVTPPEPRPSVLGPTERLTP